MSSRSRSGPGRAGPLGVQGSLVHLHFHPTKKKNISDTKQSPSRDKIIIVSPNKQEKPSRIPIPVHSRKKQCVSHGVGNGAAAAAMLPVVVRMPSCEPINPWSGGIEHTSSTALPECPVSSSSPLNRTKSSHAHPLLTQTVLLSSPKIVGLENAVIRTEERLKKLRFRYLTRKYASVWIIKAFGRVSPAKARAHYEQQLMMTMFMIWQEQWWSAHHEWKLNIRADCHDRYRLWQKVWRGWLEYIRIRVVKQKKWKLAEQFRCERLSRQVFTKWQDYVLVRKNKELLNARANLHHSKQLLRVSWKQWSTVFGTSRLHNHTHLIAVAHYSKTLQLKTFLMWRSMFVRALVNKDKAQTALKHYFTALCKKCVHSWTVYVDMRHCKADKRVIANELHCRAMLHYYLSLWRSRAEQSRSLIQFEQQIEARSCLARKRRSLAAWRHFVRLRCDYYQLMNTATDHYNNVLKHKLLRVLIVHVQFQDHKRKMTDIADKFNRAKLMGKVWSVWLKRSEHSEEMKFLPLTRKARLLFRNVTLRNALNCWRRFVEWSREKKLKQRRADLYFKQIMLPKCFMAMRWYTDHQQHQKELQERAEWFRRETLSSMVFYHWWSACQLSQDLRLMERIAVLHHEDVLKKSALTQWRSASNIKRQQTMLEHLATGHHQYNVLSSAYTLWNQLWQERILRRHQQQVAIVHNTMSLLKISWIAWLKYVMHRRADHSLRNTAEHRFSCTVLGKCIAAWKVHHQRQVIKKRKVRAAKILHSQHLMRRLLHRWSSNVAAQKSEATLIMVADQHWKSVITHKVFVSWWERTSVKKEKAVAVETLVDKAVQLLRKSKQRRLLLLWRDRAEEYARHQLKLQLADRHHTRKVLHKCLTAWLTHYRITLKVTLLQRQGVWFEHIRLVSLFYGNWRVQLMNVLIERQKTANALWYWSRSLQRKTFFSWREYVIDRKRKKSRYAAAMDWHRQYLVKIGVQQWIEVASSIKTLRIEQNLRQQTQTTERVWQHVRKCANHWRNVTRRRRRKRNDEDLLAHAHSKPSIARVAVRPVDPGWERIAQQLKLSSPHQRPAPRMPTFLLHQSSSSELSPLPPHFPMSPPHSLHRPTFSDLSSSCSSYPGKNSPNKPSVFQPSYITSGGIAHSHLSDDHNETLLPPSAFAIIPTLPDHHQSNQPVSLDLSDPATQQQVLQARDSLREVIRLKQQQRALSEQLSSSKVQEDQAMLQHQLEEVTAQLHHHGPVVRGTVNRLIVKHIPHH